MMTRLPSQFCFCGLIILLSSSIAATILRGRPKNRTELCISLLQSCKWPQCVSQRANVVITKKVQLYSRASGRFVQIKTTEVDARGEKGSPYASLVLEGVGVNVVMIRGEKTNRYLCLNKRGDIVTMEKRKSECQFSETITDKGYSTHRSVKYPQWFVGFSRQGRAKNGRKKCKKCRHFLLYNIR